MTTSMAPNPMMLLQQGINHVVSSAHHIAVVLFDSLSHFANDQWILLGTLLTFLLIAGHRLNRLGKGEGFLLLLPLCCLGGVLKGLSIVTSLLVAGYAFVLLAFLHVGFSSLDAYHLWQQVWYGPIHFILLGNIAGLGLGTITYWWLARVIEPSLNKHFKNKTRTQQSEDQLTDIRTVKALMPKTAKTYDPIKHFKPDHIFIGLDIKNEPIYVSRKVWCESHVQLMGTTGFGKGLAAMIQLAHALKHQDAVFVIDPKNDRWAPKVLKTVAEQLNLPFQYINLGLDQPAQFNLLKAISPDHFEELMDAGMALSDSGRDSDFYRQHDRNMVRCAKAYFNHNGNGEQRTLSLIELYQLLQENESKPMESAPNFATALEELATLPCIQTREGPDFRETIRKGGVIYIAGHTKNTRIVRLQKMLLVRIMQLIEERDRDQALRHVCVFLDEFKYVLTKVSLQALGTLRDFSGNVILAHQSLGDLNEVGRDITPESAKGAVLENTAIKLIYQAQDPDTADWIARKSGTILVDQVRYQVERNEALSETLKSDHGLEKTKRHLIDSNMLAALPKRCGVLFQPNQQARVVFTSPIPTNTEKVSVNPVDSINPVLLMSDVERVT